MSDVRGILIPQLFLDMFHLLAQDVFLLVFADPFGHFTGNLVLDLHPLYFVGQMHIDFFQTLQRVGGLQQFLKIGHRQIDVQCHQIGQAGRVVDVVDHLHDIVRQRLAV